MSAGSAIVRLATSPREAMWLARHLVLLTTLPALIRVMPLPALLRILTPTSSRRFPRLGKAPDADRIVTITDWLLGHSKGNGRTDCLKRSLALYHQLRRSGMPVELCLGVRRSSLGLASHMSKLPLHGHAWLARGDTVLYEGSAKVLSVYAETYRYPPPVSGDAAS
jgi:hypothetical protein